MDRCAARPATTRKNRASTVVGSLHGTLSQFLGNSDEVAAAHSELRSEYANARSVSDLIDGVEDVHDIKAHRDWLFIGFLELMRNADIGSGVRRDMIGIGEATAQAAAVDHA